MRIAQICVVVAEQDPAYFHTSELAGSLRSTEPLPLFDANPQHLWNRLFAAVMIRPELSAAWLALALYAAMKAMNRGTNRDAFKAGEALRLIWLW